MFKPFALHPMITGLLLLAVPLCSVPAAEVDPFNYVVGTQTFGASYQFTQETRLVETANVIRQMEANVIKFGLSSRYADKNGNVPSPDPSIRSLTELAGREPSHRKVLDMPFAYYVLWAHTFSGAHERWRNGFSKQAQEAEYREMYDLVRHLLTTYNNSGKTFFLGHWEGDGLLRRTVKPENDARVTPEAVQGMADWLNARQRAVDDAKRDTPHTGVQVWHYTEVNHVKLVMQGRKAMTSEVLPKVPVDFVSYSAYDTANDADPRQIKAALDLIESKLAPKPHIQGKRVFIGEYGFPAARHSPAQQDEKSRIVIQTALEWGCPFVLYWELYNNEVDAEGHQRGFWLIDDKNRKQPVWFTHQRFLAQAKSWVAGYKAQNHRPPSHEEFCREAVKWLGAPK